MLAMIHLQKSSCHMKKVLCKIVGVDILALWESKLSKNKLKVRLF